MDESRLTEVSICWKVDAGRYVDIGIIGMLM